jgi:HAMP domain-containing protein
MIVILFLMPFNLIGYWWYGLTGFLISTVFDVAAWWLSGHIERIRELEDKVSKLEGNTDK